MLRYKQWTSYLSYKWHKTSDQRVRVACLEYAYYFLESRKNATRSGGESPIAVRRRDYPADPIVGPLAVVKLNARRMVPTIKTISRSLSIAVERRAALHIDLSVESHSHKMLPEERERERRGDLAVSISAFTGYQACLPFQLNR